MESLLNGKDPDAGRDWGQEDKGMTEDEMAGWHLLWGDENIPQFVVVIFVSLCE